MASIIISGLALTISAFSFYLNSPRAIQRRMQIHQIRALASQAVVLYDQCLNVAVAGFPEGRLDPYLIHSMRNSAKTLNGLMSEALTLDLWSLVIDMNNICHPVQYHCALIQSLDYCAAPDSAPEDFTKEHLLMGLIRLLDGCQQSGKLSSALQRQVGSSLPRPETIQIARTYLDQKAI